MLAVVAGVPGREQYPSYLRRSLSLRLLHGHLCPLSHFQCHSLTIICLLRGIRFLLPPVSFLEFGNVTFGHRLLWYVFPTALHLLLKVLGRYIPLSRW